MVLGLVLNDNDSATIEECMALLGFQYTRIERDSTVVTDQLCAQGYLL